MRAYVINLDRDPERMEQILKQGKELGITWSRVSAVDKLDGEIVDRASRAIPGLLGFTLSAGAIACFESHRKAWRLIVDSGESHGAVFEDDVVCSKDLPAFLSTEWIPADCDVIKLETFLERATISAKPDDFSGRKIVRLYGRHLGTCGYIISRGAAERLLAASANFSDAVDEFLFNAQSLLFPQVKLYQVDPALCVQSGLIYLDSDAQHLKSRIDRDHSRMPARYTYRRYMVRKVLRLFEKLFMLLGILERRKIEFK